MKNLTSTADNRTDAMNDFLSQLETPTQSFEIDGEVEIIAQSDEECQFYANFIEVNHEEDESYPHSITFYSNSAQTEFWGEVELTY